jgi:hypothetical protein
VLQENPSVTALCMTKINILQVINISENKKKKKLRKGKLITWRIKGIINVIMFEKQS